MKLIVNSPDTLSKAIGSLRAEYNKYHFVRLNMVSGKHRGVQINALSHVWYKQISDERGEMTPSEVKSFCKLHFGVPILRRDNEEFAEKYDNYIKPLPYPHKLSIISMVDITSEMTNPQMKEYMEEVKAHFETLPTDPVILEWPPEE